ncbi:hypothetical protein [Kitasatospora sp. NPDC017646]|uniref:hypothetical protein n=1 Tax=Kitasatospora sp. NPDC017646 TaxID=3364024 RepID=UPI003793EAAC
MDPEYARFTGLAVRARLLPWCARCDQPLNDTLHACVSTGGIVPWFRLIDESNRADLDWVRAHLYQLVAAGIRILISWTEMVPGDKSQRLYADLVLVLIGAIQDRWLVPETRSALMAALRGQHQGGR